MVGARGDRGAGEEERVTRDREKDLRRARVLDGSKLDAARLAFLGIYESAREHQRERAPAAAAIRDEVAFALDPVMRGTE